MFYLEITSEDGTRYQDHGSIDLAQLDANIKAADLDYLQGAFFLPGTYKLAAAIFDTASGEHSAQQISFKIHAPRQAFLLDTWRNLPAVEFIAHQESPDSWYLPHIHGELRWVGSLAEPVSLNVILNIAKSGQVPGVRATPSEGMPALIPTLKLISQSGSDLISEQLELLDLARHRAVFHQQDVHELDWPGLKGALAAANTASIDLHSLSERHHDAQFFISQVRKVIKASGKPSVLVVLTTSVQFESGEDLTPISLGGLPGCQVIYIRFHGMPDVRHPTGPQLGSRGRGSRIGYPMNVNRPGRSVFDELAGTLKPLSPKVFDVQTPEEMTKALAEIRRLMEGK
jgi:hypothetical protein